MCLPRSWAFAGGRLNVRFAGCSEDKLGTYHVVGFQAKKEGITSLCKLQLYC